MAEGIFRGFQKEHRPLSWHLQRSIAEPLAQRIREMASEDLEETTVSLVTKLVEEVRVDGPQLHGTEPGRSSYGEGAWRPGSTSSSSVGTNRHFVAIEVTGDIHLLGYWPDKADTGLVPVDAFTDDPWGPEEEPYDENAAVRRHEQRLAQERWFLGIRDTETNRFGLYTFLDLTDADELQVASGQLDPRALIDHERAAIEPIVVAVAGQTKTFFDADLPAYLAAIIDERKEFLAARAAVRANLTWPNGWKFDSPRVVHDPPPMPEPVSESVSVKHRARLDSASFDDVLRTMRVWADAVERHPRSYRDLPEDHLSDQMAATLNAALPGASREVYTRGGKSDIFIRADVLGEGLSPAKVFICENKWWSGPANALKALDQLLGYLEVKDTAGVLGFFIKSADARSVRRSAESSLMGATTFLRMRKESVAGWPILQFEHHERRVDVCLAFIDLPDR